VVSTAARSPDISSTWQPKRQAIQAVYAKGMMFLFLVHVYTTFTLRSHWIHTTFTLRCSHFSHSHQAETVWFPGLLGLPGSSTAQIKHVCFTSSFPLLPVALMSNVEHVERIRRCVFFMIFRNFPSVCCCLLPLYALHSPRWPALFHSRCVYLTVQRMYIYNYIYIYYL
jgi:hypothetical protein